MNRQPSATVAARVASGTRRSVLAAAVALALMSAPSGVRAASTPVIQTNSPAPLVWGLYDPAAPQDMSALSADESAIGKRAGIVMWYEHWFTYSAGVSQPWTCTPSYFTSVLQHGSIPMLSWVDDMAFDPVPIPDPQFSNSNVLQQLANTGSADYQEVDSYARCLASIPGPVYLRFDYEMNGNWNDDSPGVNGNAADGSDFRALWQRVHDIFTADRAVNVRWVWSPNVEYNGSAPLCDVYPGDVYVDWVGVDGYNWGTQGGKQWQTLTQVFGPTIADETGLPVTCPKAAAASAVAQPPDASRASTAAKPLMITEVSTVEATSGCDPVDVSDGQSKANWVLSGLKNEVPGAFPAVRAVVWFSQENDSCHDWRFASSSASQQAFATAVGANPQYLSGDPSVLCEDGRCT